MYKGDIEIYHYDNSEPCNNSKQITDTTKKLALTTTSIIEKSDKAIKKDTGNVKIVEPIFFKKDLVEQANIRIAQFLENPNLHKRIVREINDLMAIQGEKIVIDVHSIDSKIHQFELTIALYDNETEEHTLTCKIPHDYPFKAPVLSLESKNAQFNGQDLIAINKCLNETLCKIHSPAKRIYEIIDMTKTTIQSYKNKKIAAQGIAQGHERTLTHLKEKYQDYDLTLNCKYPELQEKLHGLWIKEMPSGYFVFHIQGDIISIAFEAKYLGTATVLYQGNYAAGYHETDKNRFQIHINSELEPEKTNCFQINAYSNEISIRFSYLADESMLNAIISELELDFPIGERINLVKI